MLKGKILILLGLLLLMALPAGVAQAQEPVLISAEISVGTAIIWDDAALSDAITFSMSGIPAAGENQVYEGWLVSDSGSRKFSTGVMAVTLPVTDGVVADLGSVNYSFDSSSTGYTGENLVHNFDKVVVTVEPVPDTDPGPSDVVAYSHLIPGAASGGMFHIRHLLTNWPPGASNGILTNLKEQLDVALLHANLSADSTDLAGIRGHLEHVINAIEGANGPNYGDLNGDGDIQDFGDGVGALAHAEDRKHGPFAVGAAADDTVIVAGAALVDTNGKNAEDWAALARDQALAALGTDNIVLARLLLGPGAYTVISSLDAARNGFDADGDGTIESIVREGGAQQAYVEAQGMATYTLVAGGLPARQPDAGPTIGLPSAGDTSVVGLAQLALVASIVLLSAGGLLLVRGRRRNSA